jgi:hypothetical protein
METTLGIFSMFSRSKEGKVGQHGPWVWIDTGQHVRVIWVMLENQVKSRPDFLIFPKIYHIWLKYGKSSLFGERLPTLPYI